MCRRCNVAESDVFIFTSHFFTQLKKGGPEAVESWTKKRNIDIFQKKLIFIPINKSWHWSLSVVVNPGHILKNYDGENGYDSDPLACMLFFDSLNLHGKATVHNNVIRWLNHEWKRLGKDTPTSIDKSPFRKAKGADTIFPILDPKGMSFAVVAHYIKTTLYIAHVTILFISSCPSVPKQNNGCDCGVFVCRYAYAMLRLRHHIFNWEGANLNKANKVGHFHDLITVSQEFDFTMSDIAYLRNEMLELVKGLSKYHCEWKKEQRSKENGKQAVNLEGSFFSQDSSIQSSPPKVLLSPGEKVPKSDVQTEEMWKGRYLQQGADSHPEQPQGGEEGETYESKDEHQQQPQLPSQLDNDDALGASGEQNDGESAENSGGSSTGSNEIAQKLENLSVAPAKEVTEDDVPTTENEEKQAAVQTVEL